MNINIGISTTDSNMFSRHAAFLGGTGSGKTTLALSIIEQLLENGIPAILIDRKGDLCGYAKDKSLLPNVKTTIYTPGNPDGNPVSISLIPQSANKLNRNDQIILAKNTADSIASMLEYKTKIELNRIPIIVEAILEGFTLDDFEFKSVADIKLILSLRHSNIHSNLLHIQDTQFKKVLEDLEVLSANLNYLFQNNTETINISNLFNPNQLSIISTKFLGDTKNVLFWVSQLLIQINTWMNKNPSDKLQGLVFLDEADMYMPAISKPSTKEPLENLLKRARSAGLSIMIATQNPGDLDYRGRDNICNWFIGSIREKVALSKIEPMFGMDYDLLDQVPSLKVGEFFFLQQGNILQFKSSLSKLKTEQLGYDEITTLARLTKG